MHSMTRKRSTSVLLGVILVIGMIAGWGGVTPYAGEPAGPAGERVAELPTDLGYGKQIANQFDDLLELMLAWKSQQGATGALQYNPAVDFDQNTRIDAGDLLTLLRRMALADKEVPTLDSYEPSGSIQRRDLPWVDFLLADNQVVDETGTGVAATINDLPYTDFSRSVPQVAHVRIELETPQADGHYAFTVHPKDGAGNFGNYYLAEYRVDGAPPEVTGFWPAVSAVPTLASVVVYLHDNVDVDEPGTTINVLKGGITFSAYSKETDVPDQITINITDQTDGIYNFTVTPRDLVGNVGAATTVQIIADNTPPTFVESSLSGGECVKQAPSVALTMHDNLGINEAASLITITRDGQPLSLGVDYTRTESVPDQVTVVFTPQQDGQYELSVRPVDLAGNPAVQTTLVQFTVDAVAPTVTGSTPADEAAVPSLTTLVVGLADNFQVTSCSVSATRDGVRYTDFNSNFAGTQTTIDINNPMDAVYTFSVAPSDCAGNTAQPVNITITSDQTAPQLVSALPPDGTNTKNFSALDFVFSDLAGLSSQNTTITATLDMDLCDLGLPQEFTGFTRVDPFTNNILLNMTPPVAEGEYRFTVSSQDVVGNALAPFTHIVRLDNTMPVVNNIRFFDDLAQPVEESADQYIRHLTRVEVDLTDAVGLDFEGTVITILRNQQPVTFERIEGSACNQIITCSMDNVVDGNYVVVVTARDLAGNIATEYNKSIVADSVAPVFVSSVPANDACGIDLTQIAANVTEAVGIDATATIVDVVLNGTPLTRNVDWNLTTAVNQVLINLATSAVGTYNIDITLVDLAGNVAAQVQSLTVYDDGAPATVVSSTPADGSVLDVLTQLVITLQDNLILDETGTVINAFRNGSSLENPVLQYQRDNSVPGQVTLTMDTPQDGLFVFNVSPRDHCQNIPAAPTVITVTADSVPPTLAYVDPGHVLDGENACVHDISTVTIVVDDNIGADEAACVVWATRAAVALVEGATGDFIRDNSVPNSIILTITGAIDADYEFSVLPVDAVGNVGATATVAIRQDSTPPVLVNTSPANGDALQNFLAITFNLSDNFAGMVDTANTSVTATKNGVLLGAGAYGRDNSVTDTITLYLVSGTIGDGTYVFTIIPRDLCGNVDGPFTVTVYDDSIAPMVVSTTPTYDSKVSLLPVFDIVLYDNINVDEALTAVTATLNGAELPEGFGYGRDNTTPNLIGLTLNVAADGFYVFSVTPVDTAGNAGPATVVPVLADNTPPVILDITALPECSMSIPYVTATLSDNVALDLAGTIAAVTRDGVALTQDVDFVVVAAGTNVVMVSLTPELNGVYEFTITPVDLRGNTGDSATITGINDNTPPAVAMSIPAAGALCSVTEWAILITDNIEVDIAGCELTVQGATGELEEGTDYLRADGPGIIAVTRLTPAAPVDATFVLTVTPIDSCGNVGNVTVIDTTSDCTVPVIGSVVPDDSVCLSTLPSVTIPVTDNLSGVHGVSIGLNYNGIGLEGNADFTVTVLNHGKTSATVLIALGTAYATAEGVFDLYLAPEDEAGNSGLAVTKRYIVDNTNPYAVFGFPNANNWACGQVWGVTVYDNLIADITNTAISVLAGTHTCTTSVLPATNGEVIIGYVGSTVDGHTIAASNEAVFMSTLGADAPYVVTVTPVDACGKLGAPIVINTTNDCTLPYVVGISPAPGCYGAPVLISATLADNYDVDEAETIVQVWQLDNLLAEGVNYTVTRTVQNQATVNILSPTQGIFTVSVQPVDRAGNEAAVVDIGWATYSFDNQAPSATVQPASGGYISCTTPGFSITVSDAVEAYAVDATVTLQNFDGVMIPNTDYTFQALMFSQNMGLTIDSSFIVNGETFELTVVPNDVCGLAGAPVVTDVTVDCVSPTVTLITPGTGCISGIGMITVNLADNYSVADLILAVSRNGALLAPGADYTLSWTNRYGTASVASIVLTPSMESSYEVSAVAVDRAGNQSPVRRVNFRDDRSIPNPIITRPVDGAYVHTMNVFWATMTDNTAISATAWTLSATVDDTTPVTLTSLVAVNAVTTVVVAATVDTPVDGVYTFYMTQKDECDNAGPAAILQVTADNTAPTLDAVIPPASCIEDITQVVFVFGDNLAGLVDLPLQLTRSGVVIEEGTDYTVAITPALMAGVTAATVEITLASNLEGVYQFAFQPQDNAGNIVTVTYTLRTDRQNPEILETIPSGDIVAVTAVNMFRALMSDTVEMDAAGSILNVTRSGLAYAAGTRNNFDYGTTAVVEYHIATNDDGFYQFDMTPVDMCGNLGASVLLSATVDSTSPVATGFSMNNLECVNEPVVLVATMTDNLAGMATPEITVTHNGAAIEYGVPAPGSNVRFSWVDIGLSALTSNAVLFLWPPFGQALIPDGSYEITVYPYDVAGNPGASTTITLLKDASIPTVSGFNPPNGAWVCDVTQMQVLLSDAVSITANGDSQLSIQCTKSDLATNTLVAASDYILLASNNVLTASLMGDYASATMITQATFVLTVTPVDYCGNAGSAVIAYVTRDCIDPSIASFTPADLSCATQTVTTVTVALADVYDPSPALTLLDIRRSGVLINDPTDYTVTRDLRHSPAQRYNVITLNSPMDATYVITATPIDNALNIGASATVTIKQDMANPTVVSVSPVNGAWTQNLTGWQVTLADAIAIDLAGSLVTIATAEGTALVAGASYTVADTTWGATGVVDLTLSNAIQTLVSDASFVLTVTPVDKCGNVGTARISYATKDTTDPIVSHVYVNDSTDATACAGLVQNVTFILSDNYDVSESGSQVTVQRNGSLMAQAPGGFSLVKQNQGATSTFKIAIAVPFDATYVFSVTPVDLAGNVGTASVVTIKDDSTVPTIVSVTPVSNIWTQNLAGWQVLLADNLSVDAANSVVTIATAAGDVDSASYVRPSTVWSGATGVIDVTLSTAIQTEVTASTFALTVTPLDLCGNAGSAVVTTATVDRVAPTVAHFYSHNTTAEATACVNMVRDVTFVLMDNYDVREASTQLSVLRNDVPMPNDGSGYTYTISDQGISSLVKIRVSRTPEDATYVFSATPYDMAGNVGAASRVTLKDDTVPPSVISASPADGAFSPLLGVWEILLADTLAYSPTDTVVSIATATGTMTAAVDYLISTTSPLGTTGLVTITMQPPWAATTAAVFVLTVTPVDTCGNVGPAVLIHATQDAIAPAVAHAYLSGTSDATACASTVQNATFILTDNYDVREASTGVSVTRNGVALVNGPAGFTWSTIAGGTTATVLVSVATPTEATYVFSVTPVDMAGNTGTAMNAQVKVDLTAPVISSVSPTNGTWANQITGWDVSVREDMGLNVLGSVALFQLRSATGVLVSPTDYNGAIIIGATTSAATVVLESTFQAMANNVYTATFAALDLCGNLSANTVVYATKDTTAPTVPTFYSSGTSSATTCADTISTVTFVLSDNYDVREASTILAVTRNGVALPNAAGGYSWAYTNGVTTSTVTITIAATQVGDATYIFSVTPADWAGNPGAATTVQVTDDSAPPAVVSILPASGAWLPSATDFQILLSDAIGHSATDATVTLEAATPAGTLGIIAATRTNGLTTGTTSTIVLQATDVWSSTNGAIFRLSVMPVDRCGNLPAATSVVYATLDTVAPVIDYVTAEPTVTMLPSATGYISSVTALRIQITDNFPNNGSVLMASTVAHATRTNATGTVSLAQGSDYTITGSTVNIAVLNLLHPMDGFYQFELTSTDLAGNISAATIPTVTADNNAPFVQTATPAITWGDNPLTGISLLLYDSVAVNASSTELKVSRNGLEIANGVDYVVVSSSSPISNLVQIIFAASAESNIIVWATMYDYAGNVNAVSMTFFDDRTAPTFTLGSPHDVVSNATNYDTSPAGMTYEEFVMSDVGPAVSGMDLANLPISVTKAGVLLVENTGWTRSYPDGITGSRVRANINSVGDATYVFSVLPTDKAGNTAVAGPTVIYVTDDSTPAYVASSSPAAGATVTTFTRLEIDIADNIKADPIATAAGITCVTAVTCGSLPPAAAFANFSLNSIVGNKIILDVTPGTCANTTYSFIVNSKDVAGNTHIAETVSITKN